ncbi:MAG: hypothetical protein KBH58_06485, partial [Pseudoxanthomonas sp.]|nr:hypothetical protein [Pseudoxanthomonas sp.]
MLWLNPEARTTAAPLEADRLQCFETTPGEPADNGRWPASPGISALKLDKFRLPLFVLLAAALG